MTSPSPPREITPHTRIIISFSSYSYSSCPASLPIYSSPNRGPAAHSRVSSTITFPRGVVWQRNWRHLTVICGRSLKSEKYSGVRVAEMTPINSGSLDWKTFWLATPGSYENSPHSHATTCCFKNLFLLWLKTNGLRKTSQNDIRSRTVRLYWIIKDFFHVLNIFFTIRLASDMGRITSRCVSGQHSNVPIMRDPTCTQNPAGGV